MRVEVDAGVSASTLERPALQRALAALRAGEAGGLVVVKLDRLTSSVKNLGELVEGPFKKSALFSLYKSIDTASASGRMLLNVLSSISQWERETIAERTKDALRYLKTQGRVTGSVPYGRRRVEGGKQLEIDPAEMVFVTLARDLRAQGLTLRAIAAELDRAGYRNRVGKPWLSTQIARMVAA